MSTKSRIWAVLNRPIGSSGQPSGSEAENVSALPKRRLKNLLYYIAAFFMPSLFLLDLYNRNRVVNQLVFGHILILSVILAVIGVLVYLVFNLTCKNAQGALLLSILFWVFFWLFETILGSAVVPRFITSTWLIIILVIVLAILTAVIRRYKPPFNKALPFFNVLSLFLVGLFVVNMIPGIIREINLARGGFFYLKSDFYVDETLPSPDILWIHVDGMMSMETVERFFEVSQDSLREELALRGFVVAPNAELNAGSTQLAYIALLSPDFYDNFFGERLAYAETMLFEPRVSFIDNELARIGLTFRDKFQHIEVFRAFGERGYRYEGTTFRAAFAPDELRQFLRAAGDLPRLLDITTPLNIVPIVERIVERFEERSENGMQHADHDNDYELLSYFTWIELDYTHMYQLPGFDPTGTTDGRDETAVHLYPLAYAHIAERMLYYVDTFLEENPDTVIVLQSDHGFHLYQTQLFLLDQGHSLDEVLELTHSVFSAVRIPERYGGLDAPLAPLNITRELVNRFVGLNYALLP